MIRSADEMLNLAQIGLEAAEKLGADEAEVYLWSADAVKAHSAGRFKEVRTGAFDGLSVRLLVDGRLSTISVSGLREATVHQAVSRAIDAAGLLPEHPVVHRFVDPQPVHAPPTPIDGTIAEQEPARLQGLADQVADQLAAGRAVDFHDATVASHVGRFAVANSRGVETWDQDAFEVLSLEVRCQGGGSHRFAKDALGDRWPLEEASDLEIIAQDAARRAADALDAAQLDRPVERLILDARATLELIGKLLPHTSGRAAARGRSPLSEALGQPVASPGFTLLDEPRGPEGCRNQRVDDEGVPTRNRALIEEGVLRTHLYDSAAASELDRAPTGHGFRGTTNRHESSPAIRVANPALQPGSWSLEEMIEAAGDAVLVRGSLMGAFTMNEVTGDFSCTAPLAYRVKGGRIDQALEHTMVSGNLFEALSNIQAVGSEVSRFRGGRTVPLWVEGVTCTT